jgi:hypothetical protein
VRSAKSGSSSAGSPAALGAMKMYAFCQTSRCVMTRFQNLKASISRFGWIAVSRWIGSSSSALQAPSFSSYSSSGQRAMSPAMRVTAW